MAERDERAHPHAIHPAWVHVAAGCITCTLILTAARAVGLPGLGTDVGRIFVNSLVAVTVAYSMMTLFAVTAMRAFGHVLPLWACALAGCLLGVLPTAFLSPTINFVLGALPDPDRVIETRAQFFSFLGDEYLHILLIAASLGPLLWMVLSYRWWAERLAPRPLEKPAAAAPADEDPAAAPVDRLPPERRGPLLALSAEEHYVRVRTEAGEGLVLTPFSRAVAALPPEMGMRIHRSHWVRGDAILRIEPTRTGLRVHLRDGTVLPVSRSYRGAVRETWRHLVRPCHPRPTPRAATRRHSCRPGGHSFTGAGGGRDRRSAWMAVDGLRGAPWRCSASASSGGTTPACCSWRSSSWPSRGRSTP